MRSTANEGFEMYIRQASPTTYRQVLREIRQKEIFKVIVDTNPSNIYFFFRAVSCLGCGPQRRTVVYYVGSR